MTTNPVSRRAGICLERLQEETILYNKLDHQAHCLNEMVFAVWQNADGTRSVEELAKLLAKQFPVSVSSELVWLALEQLENAGLLEVAPARNEVLPSRREIGRRLALAGISVSAIPFITSILAPTPAMARSYTGKSYEQELTTVQNDIANNVGKYWASSRAQGDLKTGIQDGAAGLNAALKNNSSAAQSDFKAAESEFDDLLKALGLPSL